MNRLLVTATAIGLIPDLFVSFIVMMFLNEGISLMIIIFFILQIARLLGGLYRFWGLRLMYRLGLKRKMSDGILKDLISYNFPKSYEYRKSPLAYNYFRSVSDDPGVSTDTRLIARQTWATIDTTMNKEGVKESFLLDNAVELALNRYFNDKHKIP